MLEKFTYIALADLHRKAVDALLDPIAGQQVRDRALAQIDKWGSKHLCNPRYVLYKKFKDAA
ncbi:MAG: hypothetical protein ABL902_08355 [Gallionella sp.]|nr:hypothetical protein [Gallionella sp.]